MRKHMCKQRYQQGCKHRCYICKYVCFNGCKHGGKHVNMGIRMSVNSAHMRYQCKKCNITSPDFSYRRYQCKKCNITSPDISYMRYQCKKCNITSPDTVQAGQVVIWVRHFQLDVLLSIIINAWSKYLAKQLISSFRN